MAGSFTLPLDHVADIIGNNVQDHIAREIERVIHSHIDPVIKDIARRKTEELCERANVMVDKDYMNGRLNISVQFMSK